MSCDCQRQRFAIAPFAETECDCLRPRFAIAAYLPPTRFNVKLKPDKMPSGNIPMEAATITLPPILKLSIDLTDEQFFALCQRNRNYRFERTELGELLIMSPTGSETGNYNGKLTQRLFNWTDTNDLGIAFDSSTGFKLPNGAERSPDASWIRWERWDVLTDKERKRFAPICPDFVVELRSETDSLKELQDKMKEYLKNGARLGWLIDRKNKHVEISRPGKDVEILVSPVSLSGEDVLPGFVLNLQGIM